MSGQVYDPLAARAAEVQSAPTQGYDPLAMVAAGKVLPAANDAAQGSSWEQNWLQHGNPVDQFVQGAFDKAITSTGGAIAGGLKGLWDLARGEGADTAAQDVEHTQEKSAYQPQTPIQSAGATVASSNWNPLNWPGVIIGKTGEFLGNTAEKLGAPPIVSTALDVAPAAAASLYGLRKAGIEGNEPVTPEAERVVPETPTEPVAAPADGPPVKGGLPKEAIPEREAILSRVGIVDKRNSALSGDAKAAATDYQLSKTDGPAGDAAAAQFEHERNAMAGFTQGLITKAGGSIGMDEDALLNRGQTIAKPFDDLQQWFKDRTTQMYDQADQEAAALRGGTYDTATGKTALTNLEGVDRLLNSRSLKNTLGAKGQDGLLNAARDQLQFFRENNPDGFTAKTAEGYRQWLNSIWTPQTSWAIGQLKNAVDEDVFKNAGENIYGAARAMRALKSATLDDPKGVSRLFEHDPDTPINRTTPFAKIPDTIMGMAPEQFQNLMDTLKSMPPELQPQAQAAIGEIKGQLLNRLLKAGSETRSGRGAQVWHGEDVSTALARHAAKFRIAFEGDPEMQAAIKDLNAAGQILRTPEGYPGAYAQKFNLTKRGIAAQAARQAARIGGAAVGGTVGAGFGAPGIGAMAGEVAGSRAGEAAAAALDEKAALKMWRERVKKGTVQ